MFCKFVAIEIQLFRIQLLIATGLMAIATGTDKNAIDRVKHHRAGAARADNGSVVYKKVGKIAQTC